MIKNHLRALIDPRLIICIIVIIAISVLLTMLFSDKVADFAKKYKKKFYIYTFSIVLIYALVAFLGYNKLFVEISDEFLFYQITTLLFGTLNVYLYRWLFHEFELDSFKYELLFSLIIMCYSSVLFILIHSVLNGLDYTFLMCTHFLLFIVPAGVYITFNFMMQIPGKEYMTWRIPPGEKPFPEIETVAMKDLLLITLLIQRHADSKTYTSIRSKGPVRIDFGPLFYNTITGYNTQYPEKKIDLQDNGENYNWVFFLQPKWYERARYVDANFTLSMNGITENSVIICKRQKKEKIKLEKAKEEDKDDFVYQPKLKNAPEKNNET